VRGAGLLDHVGGPGSARKGDDEIGLSLACASSSAVAGIKHDADLIESTLSGLNATRGPFECLIDGESARRGRCHSGR